MRAHEPAPLFAVVLQKTGAPEEPVVLHAALDADHATIAFHETRRRLIQERVRGELLVMQDNRTHCLVLREPLSMGIPLPVE